MITFYPQIKLAHITFVLCSGALFLLRAVGVQLSHQWPMSGPIRYLSYTVDTVLLTSALMLMTMLHQFPFANSWLTVKITLVVIYIVLGSLALKRARTPRARLACAIAALLTFGMIVSVAVTHHPHGALVWFRY